MTSREDKAVAALEASILELRHAVEDLRGGYVDEAMTRIFKGHAFSGAARMYLDQEKAIELATGLERHASRVRARRPARGTVRP